MGKKRKLQGNGKALKIDSRVTRVHKRRCTMLQLETLARYARNISHSDIFLSVGLGKRNELSGQFREVCRQDSERINFEICKHAGRMGLPTD